MGPPDLQIASSGKCSASDSRDQPLRAGAKVYWRGDVNSMILNAQTVITQWSSCTFVAMALGKEVYSDLNANELRRLMPIQNGGTSASKIAQVCQQVMNTPMPVIEQRRRESRIRTLWENLGIQFR
jgi:hypothetical protein